jgi:glycerol-3-phosphate dehydrogenase
MISRERAIETLTAERFDVTVIGGGVTGAGVALDAASRGYSVALLERADFAAGTSRRSSRLIHGGLRYLQNSDLGLVREALLERRLLVKLAPHLVKPLSIVVAAVEGARPDRLTGFGTALGLSDLRGDYAGVRPLISSEDARKSVDPLVERDGREAPCRTAEIPLGQPIRPQELSRVSGLADESYSALAGRYGHAAEKVLEIAGERPELAAPMLPGFADLLAEGIAG